MANTFNNYYLNAAGLAALIEKIKANDNQLAALLGFDSGWTDIDTTDDNFKSVLERLEEAISGSSEGVINEVKEILGYNDANWPTDQTTGEKLTVQERLAGLTSDVAEASSMASAAFNRVEVVQDNDNQQITLTFYSPDNTEGEVKTIDTTDFIVHGILNSVDQVELDTTNVEAVSGVIKYKRGENDYLTLPDKVLRELAGLAPDADVSGIGVADITAGLPATYLLMSFGTHPDPDGSSIHEDEEPVWVNLSSMFKQYTFAASNPDLVNVTEANGTVTVAPGEKLEDLVSVFTDSETGEIVIPDFPAVALGETEVNSVWENGEL